MTETGRPLEIRDIPYCPRNWAKPFHDSFKRWFALVLHRRCGKAQPLTAKVLTPTGFVRMGDIAFGDTVMTPSGRPSRVIGVFPQGLREVFQVRMADGSETFATAEHLWAVKYANRRRNPQVTTTHALMQFLGREARKTTKNKSRPLIGLVSPEMDFGVEPRRWPIDPYLLGLLLGDGGLSQTGSRGGVRFSSADPELPQAIKEAGYDIRRVTEGGYDYRVNAIQCEIRALGLGGTHSATKFIPPSYLRGRRATRLAVLQGLLDTDGSATGGSRIEFCSVSKRLATETANLCRSLGWMATVSGGTFTHYTHKGERRQGQLRYRVNIRPPQGAKPFRLRRKMAIFTGYRFTHSRHAIVSIKPAGFRQCQCIALDDPDQLYVTDDFIVTHNTTAVANHHQRACLSDDWERQRLRTLVPDISDKDLQELVKPPGGRHYAHIMPTYKQAKMVVWDKIKYYARPVRGVQFNEQELLVRYPNGTKLQLFGADTPDGLRGPAFSGVSFDEYSQQPQNIFGEIISKALADHLGYAIFLGTIKGKDHLYKTHAAAARSPDWFALWQDIDKSLASEEGATILALRQAMEDDRKLVADGLMTQDDFDQEWYLSAEAAVKGAWFSKEMATAKAEQRIRNVPHDALLKVDTDWDLGMDDSMTIWFSQSLRSGEIRLIDYYENTGEGFPHYAQVLEEKARKHGYVYGQHWAPHDIKVRELGTGKSRIEAAAALGIKFQVVQSIPFEDGINAIRLTLPKCWFDETKCARGIECLRNYRKVYNTKMDMFTGTPVHDTYSHGADAFRGLSVRHQVPKAEKEQQKQELIYNIGMGQGGPRFQF